MYRLLAAAATVAVMTGPAVAQVTYVYDYPCERGPVPKWSLINDSKPGFVDFIQQLRPTMPRDVAGLIAHDVCDDLTVVGDSVALSNRLRILIRQYGY